PFQKETEIPGQESSVFQREDEITEPPTTEAPPFVPSIEALLREEPETLPIVQDLIDLIGPKSLDLRIPFKDRMTFDQAIGVMAQEFVPFPLVLDPDNVVVPLESGIIRGDKDDFINFQTTGEIKPLKGPIGTGIIGFTVRGAINMTERLKQNAPKTIGGLITAPFLIAWGGMRTFVQDASSLGGEGHLFSDEFREKFGEVTGDVVLAPPVMSPHELDEAHRAFAGLLASSAVGGVLFKTLGRPSFQLARQLGAEKATALTQARFIRAKTTGVTALGVFGAVAGESTEKEENFVMFALAAIPLGLTFHALKSIGAKTPEITDGPGRAAFYQQQRAARPFNRETTPVPEVRITRDRAIKIPLGREPRVRVGEEFAIVTNDIKLRTESNREGTGFGAIGTIPEGSKVSLANKFGVHTITFPNGETVFVKGSNLPLETLGLVGKEVVKIKADKPEIQETREAVQEQVGRVLDRENIFLEERAGEVERIEPPKAEPLVPEVLAERLDNYVRHQGDEVAIIIRNLETEPSKMVVVPGVETPARALTVAREIEGKDAIVAVHLRPDGRFDVAVGRKGSPLDNPNNFRQFTEEGYFAGQRISVDGKNLIYIGKSGEQSFVRVPGDPRLIKIDTKDIRRMKDVSVETQIPVPTAEKQLEGVITPEEIEVYKALREELHPTEPSTEARTFEQIRDIASTNGLELTRTASNTF
ncbi:hypothetical protein LCGC14_2061450, partial [marine sediment metagenome]